MSKINDGQNYSESKNDYNPIFRSLKHLRDEVEELYHPRQVPVINEIPEPLKFYRSWVAPNIPLLIKGGISHWNACKKWNKSYLCGKLKDKLISVAVTPTGYADAVSKIQLNGREKEIFVLPEERLMTLEQFYNELDASADSKNLNRNVYYIQKQNSNLVEEFPELLPDIDADLLWASESFNAKPTAINLWIGDQRAVTSLHKDPFENIYCVISGYKDFILLPPTDRPWLPYKTFPVGKYDETRAGSFDVKMFGSDEWMMTVSNSRLSPKESSIGPNEVPWIALDPSSPDLTKYPMYRFASPIHVRVEKGDMLYLPSLWFHYVKQSHKCIAVNYWYDMNLDIKYAYFQLLEKLSENLDSKA